MATVAQLYTGGSGWSLSETLRLLELYIDKDVPLWDERARVMEEEFGSRHPAGFFTGRVSFYKILKRPKQFLKYLP